MKFTQSDKMRKQAHRLIPGGCHTYAKGDDQYPVLSPGFIQRGEGCHVWDVDGNEFIEYGMGNRCVGLGHAFPEVVDAVRDELTRGVNFTRPAPLEIECGEELLSMIPGAEMVKFCKDGSSATTAALKIARAVTGRDMVACCADHPFFATNDWFIGTTPMDSGIPKTIKDMTLTFRYNDIESVEQMFEQHKNQIAGLILEPAKYEDPQDNFLHKVMDLCHRHGALFILDEMITGFRWHNGGGQTCYDIVPDLSTFGKALGNGFSVSALAGKRQYMELGGLEHDRERLFLLSTTHGAETHALAAAIATMRVYQEQPVIETLYKQGERLRSGAERVIAAKGLSDFIQIHGLPCCLVYSTCDNEGNPSQEFRSLFLQETIRRGLLMTTMVVSYSHSDEDIDKTIHAIDQSLDIYRDALDYGVQTYLVGRPSQVVQRRYNHPQSEEEATPLPINSGLPTNNCPTENEAN